MDQLFKRTRALFLATTALAALGVAPAFAALPNSVGPGFAMPPSLPGDFIIIGPDGSTPVDSGMKVPKSNSTNSNPTANSDSAQGYSVGSTWVNTATQVSWQAVSVAANAAVWVITYSPQPLINTATTNPVLTSDSNAGFSPGSTWTNTLSGLVFKAISTTPGAAVWVLEGLFSPRYTVGNWRLAAGHEIEVAGTAIASTTTVALTPFFVTRTHTIDQVGLKIGTAGTTNYQVSIYASDPATGLPTGAPLATTPSVVDTSTGAAISGTFASALHLNPGMYWEGAEANDTTVVFVGPTTGLVAAFVGSSLPLNTTGGAAANTANCMTISTTAFGTWPTLAPTAANYTFAANGGKCAVMVEHTSAVP